MLSICIPIYNYNVTTLVNELHRQGEETNVDYEILLFDDGSVKFREENRGLTGLKNVYYEELEYNVGRSKIRNLLSQKAKYRYLIFMDCDARVLRPDYLEKYIVCCRENIVCYGGRKHPEKCPGEKYKLRWKYGRNREDLPVSKRELCPNESFITFNFLIDRNIFQSIRFDERLKSYGHEDTLFGIALKHIDIIVKHIDNPLCHIGLETSDSFIKQTESSIKNLIKIQDEIDSSDEFVNSVRLLKTYYKIKKLHLIKILSSGFRLIQKALRRNLLGEHPNLLFFDLYKLGYLCSLKKK